MARRLASRSAVMARKSASRSACGRSRSATIQASFTRPMSLRTCSPASPSAGRRVLRPGQRALGPDHVGEHVVHVPAGQRGPGPRLLGQPGEQVGDGRPLLAQQADDAVLLGRARVRRPAVRGTAALGSLTDAPFRGRSDGAPKSTTVPRLMLTQSRASRYGRNAAAICSASALLLGRWISYRCGNAVQATTASQSRSAASPAAGRSAPARTGTARRGRTASAPRTRPPGDPLVLGEHLVAGARVRDRRVDQAGIQAHPASSSLATSGGAACRRRRAAPGRRSRTRRRAGPSPAGAAARRSASATSRRTTRAPTGASCPRPG